MRADGQAAGSTPVAFVVRVVRDEAGRLAGVVERIRTGEKERFQDAAAIGPLITRMLGAVPERDGGSTA
jgi:hypothetical protein